MVDELWGLIVEAFFFWRTFVVDCDVGCLVRDARDR